MKKTLVFIFLAIFYLTILLLSNWIHHDRAFVFDRDFLIILTLLIIWIIATLLVIRFVKDKDFIIKDGGEPADKDFFLKNRSTVVVYCIQLFTILPLFFYMNSGNAPIGVSIIPILLLASFGSIGGVISILNSQRRKWRKENNKLK